MFFWDAEGDFGRLILGLVISLAIGAFCGAAPLIVGLMRGHKQMAWTGFAVCVLFGLGCWFVALLPAIVFTIVVAVTKPIEKRKKKRSRRRRRRERAEDFLGDADDYNDRQRRRRRYEEENEEDDEDDPDVVERRPRRRRRRDDDD